MESQLLITIQLAHNLLVYLSTEITLFIYLVELRMVYTFGRMIISISQRVADWGNHRIQLFRQGQQNAITVAGNSSLNQTITLNPHENADEAALAE